MTLISLIIALLVERRFAQIQQWRSQTWFKRYFHFIDRYWPQTRWGGALFLLLLLVPLALGLDLAMGLFDDVLLGLIQLFIATIVLLVTLGPGDLDRDIDGYLHAEDEHDHNKSRFYAARLLHREIPPDGNEEVEAVARAILIEANHRYVAVFFWFLFMGPAGALVYRLCEHMLRSDSLTLNESVHRAVYWLYGFMGWAPAHLLAASFLLTGGFEEGVEAWRKSQYDGEAIKDPETHANELLQAVGWGAMHSAERRQGLRQTEIDVALDTVAIRRARGMVLRSIVVWLAVIALLTLGGWAW